LERQNDRLGRIFIDRRGGAAVALFSLDDERRKRLAVNRRAVTLRTAVRLTPA
jgi:hypothetical protein